MMVWFSKSSVMCAVLSGVMMWSVDVPLAWVVGIGGAPEKCLPGQHFRLKGNGESKRWHERSCEDLL